MTLLLLGIALCVIGALTEISGIRHMHRATETYNNATETFNRAAALHRERLEMVMRNKNRGVA